MASAPEVYVPAIYPADVDTQLMDAAKLLRLHQTSLHLADIVVLPSIQLRDLCEPLSDPFLLDLARYSVGQNRASPGRAVTVDWLLDSTQAGGLLPLEAYVITLEVVEAKTSTRAEGEWIIEVEDTPGPDEVGRRVDSEALCDTPARPHAIGNTDNGGALSDVSPSLDSSFDPDPPRGAPPALDGLSPASSPLSPAPSSRFDEITLEDTTPPGTPPATSASTPERSTPQRSTPQRVRYRKAGAGTSAGPHTYPGETKGYRNRSIVREVDKDALQILIRLLRDRLAEEERPVRSLKAMFKELDGKEPHPRGLQWRTTYQAYPRQIKEAVPELVQLETGRDAARVRPERKSMEKRNGAR